MVLRVIFADLKVGGSCIKGKVRKRIHNAVEEKEQRQPKENSNIQ